MTETKQERVQEWGSKLSVGSFIDILVASITVSLFVAAFAAAFYTGKGPATILNDWIRIMTSPDPLITDYFQVAGLSAAFFNAGVCGLICTMFMILLEGSSKPNSFAGYILVIAHCFYGLNPITMMPCFMAPMLYIKLQKLKLNDNLHICMFSTCFAPFISEFLFRYTLGDAFVQGEVHVTASGILIAAIFAFILGFVVPAILPGANAWHKGYNLYNGGLAFGIFGFFVYNFMYTSFGVQPPKVLTYVNPTYDVVSHSFGMFVNIYFITIFLLAIFAGFLLNGSSFKGYRELLRDTGYRSSFADRYSMPVCLMNLGFYGLTILLYINFVMFISYGVGFTGPTTGATFAALTFVFLGQHPKIVLPIFGGFIGIYLLNAAMVTLTGLNPGWTISSQGYINAAAFATGICPLVGVYGWFAGFIGGIIDAAICSSTSALHGGLVLYNGGFTAGITVLMLLPILEHYAHKSKRSSIPMSMEHFFIVEHGKDFRDLE
ncbi:MAG: DUF1576 domain-containing protein [Eubacteriales bacterium]|nr:DUF1576 domain-containing protein [Eubacteriales bacterium]